MSRQSSSIYLIQPNMFTPDVTYEVFAKDEYIYFCRCGGQGYGLDFSIDDLGNATSEELLAHKKSFRLRKDEVKSVSINSKHSFWTGGIANSGTVVIETDGKKKYIIHAFSSATKVQKFFRENTNCEIDIRFSKQRKYKEDFEREVDNQDPKEMEKLKMIALLMNVAGVIAALCLWFLRVGITSTRVSVIVCSVLPIIAIIFYIINKRKISLVDYRNEKRPNIAVAVLAPSLAMAILSLTSVAIRSIEILFLIILTVSIVMTALILFLTKEYRISKTVFFALPFVFCTYLFGMVMMTNMFSETNTPRVYNVKVLEKEYSEPGTGGKYKHRNLQIEDWLGKKDYLNIAVSEKKFGEIEQGEIIKVYVLRGFWRIEWFFV